MTGVTLPDSPQALRYLYTLEFIQGRLKRESRAQEVVDNRSDHEGRLHNRATAWLANERVLYVGSHAVGGLALLSAEGERTEAEVARSAVALFGLLEGAIATLYGGRLEGRFWLGRADDGVASLQAQLLFPDYVAGSVRTDLQEAVLGVNASRSGAVQAFMSELLGYAADVRRVAFLDVLDEWTHDGGRDASFDGFVRRLAADSAGVKDERLARMVAQTVQGALMAQINRPGAYNREIGRMQGRELATTLHGLKTTHHPAPHGERAVS